MKALQIFYRTTYVYLRNTVNPLQRNLSTTSRRTFQQKQLSLEQSPLIQLLSRTTRRKPINRLPSKRLNSTKPPFNPTPNLGSPEPSLSLSQRLRKLSREYGWSALGVYLALTALDFPFCFLAVRWLGTDRIGHWEHIVTDWFWSVVPYPFPPKDEPQAVEFAGVGTRVQEYASVDPQSTEVGIPGDDHGVKEADARNKSENASKWKLYYSDNAGVLLLTRHDRHLDPTSSGLRHS